METCFGISPVAMVGAKGDQGVPLATGEPGRYLRSPSKVDVEQIGLVGCLGARRGHSGVSLIGRVD